MLRGYFPEFGGRKKKAKQTDEIKPAKRSDKSRKKQRRNSRPESSKNIIHTEVEEQNENVDENTKLADKHQINQHMDNIAEPKCEGDLKRMDIRTFEDDNDKMRRKSSLILNHKDVMFDTGKPCNSCSRVRLNRGELRCKNCFSFACLHCNKMCECMGECFCYKFQNVFEKQIRSASNELTKRLKQHEPIESVSSANTYEIHDSRKTTVISSVTISKAYKSDESMQAGKQNYAQHGLSNDNYMEISILEYEDDDHVFLRRSQTVRVLLGMIRENIAVGIYSKDGLEKEITFIENLKKTFHREEIQLINVKQCARVLKEDKMPIIVTCPLHSRLYSDMNNVLSGIKEEYYKRIILILYHYKKEDREAASVLVEYENKFPALKCIDFFHQKRLENIESVATEIKLALYEMRKMSDQTND
ncbi:uncharacterized protein LOC128554837 [Mercenaria mercenaria]|uniref:uncharacterized protein LOC128554837 n=1 Tax=Mercenaria mercenaria TaxID=6596 RepID=UPI00234E817C|nr:uncharacterized protein LOC128554837 [Mercenaria mercenaria]